MGSFYTPITKTVHNSMMESNCDLQQDFMRIQQDCVEFVDPTSRIHAVNLNYADGNYVRYDNAFADINMNDHRIVRMHSPSDPNDAANKSYVDTAISGVVSKSAFAEAFGSTNNGGAKNAYTATTPLGTSGNVTGTLIVAKINAATNDAASTLAVDGHTAQDIRKNDMTALSGGELVNNTVHIFYNDGAYWILIV